LGSWICWSDIDSHCHLWLLTLKGVYAEGLQQRREKQEILSIFKRKRRFQAGSVKFKEL